MLQKCIQADEYVLFGAACRLPAAAVFDVAQVFALMRNAACRHMSAIYFWDHLFKLPAARKLGSQELEQLLQSAVESGWAVIPGTLRLLVKHPAASGISTECVYGLVDSCLGVQDGVHKD
jgi:hypothetical protein